MPAAGDLWITDLVNLKTQQIAFKPLQVRSATPLPDPAEVLLGLSTTGNSPGSSRLVVYSIQDQTFSAVEDDRIAASPLSGARTVYLPAVKRVAIISGATIKPITDLKQGRKLGMRAFVQQMQEEYAHQQQEAAAAVAQRLGYRTMSTVNGIPVMAGPVAELSRAAQIEAVGVYESSSGAVGAGRRGRSGPVVVALKRSAKPIVLVLSSYEPVSWQITNAGAQLQAVLLAGHHDSTVDGAGTVRVLELGQMYAYERGSSGFSQLQEEVIRWTGKPIDTFQGKYSASLFSVGGL